MENYYIPLEKLMRYMVIHPATVWVGSECFEYPMTLMPDGWDGTITMKAGRKRDVRQYDELYKFLGRGILR